MSLTSIPSFLPLSIVKFWVIELESVFTTFAFIYSFSLDSRAFFSLSRKSFWAIILFSLAFSISKALFSSSSFSTAALVSLDPKDLSTCSLMADETEYVTFSTGEKTVLAMSDPFSFNCFVWEDIAIVIKRIETVAINPLLFFFFLLYAILTYLRYFTNLSGSSRIIPAPFIASAIGSSDTLTARPNLSAMYSLIPFRLASPPVR